MSDPVWPMLAVIFVGFGLVAAASVLAMRRWPDVFDEKTWPCERFGDREIEHVPARCIEFFKGQRPTQAKDP